MTESDIKQIDFILNVIQDLNLQSEHRFRAVITVNGKGFYFQYPELPVIPDNMVMLYAESWIGDQWTEIMDWKMSIQENRSVEDILSIYAKELIHQGILMQVRMMEDVIG